LLSTGIIRDSKHDKLAGFSEKIEQEITVTSTEIYKRSVDRRKQCPRFRERIRGTNQTGRGTTVEEEREGRRKRISTI
jgi:hypothetical protein